MRAYRIYGGWKKHQPRDKNYPVFRDFPQAMKTLIEDFEAGAVPYRRQPEERIKKSNLGIRPPTPPSRPHLHPRPHPPSTPCGPQVPSRRSTSCRACSCRRRYRSGRRCRAYGTLHRPRTPGEQAGSQAGLSHLLTRLSPALDSAALAMENLCVSRLPWEDGEPRECATAFAYFVDFEAHRGDPKPNPQPPTPILTLTLSLALTLTLALALSLTLPLPLPLALPSTG